MTRKLAKVMLLLVTVVVVASMVAFGCAAPTEGPPTEGPPTEVIPRAVPAPQGPWDNAGYFPISMEGKRIDMLHVLESHPVHMNIKQGAIDQNANIGFKISHYDEAFSVQKMNDIVDASISRGVDAVLMTPIDAATGASCVERLQAAGIPVIVQANATDYLADITVLPNWYNMGAMAGEYLARVLDYKGEVGQIVGEYTAPSGIARVQAFKDVIAKYPDMQLVVTTDTPTGPWTRQGAYDAMKGVLSAHPDIDGMFGVDDELAAGIVLALAEAGKAGSVVVVGASGDRSAFQSIKEGELDATIAYSPYDIGKFSIDAAFYLLSSPGYKAGTLQGVKWMDLTIVTKDNVDAIPWLPLGG